MTRLRTRSVPRDDEDCGWLILASQQAPEDAVHPCLTGDLSAATAVVGAGFTGLAAARRAAELAPDERTVLLDAQRAGHGASGRASGFVVDIAFFHTAMAAEEAERHVRLARHGIETLRRLANQHGIECAWDDTGWIHAAAGEVGLADLSTLAAWLDARGQRYSDLGPDGMARVTGTRFYRRGLRLPGRPLVQAAALVRGLAGALPEPVELYERSPVLSIEAAGAGAPGRWRLETPEGSVTARRVLLATNGCTPLLGALGRRIFPLVTFASLTRSLTPAERDALGGEEKWGVLAQDPMGSTLRRTPEGRLLVRNTLHYHRDLQVEEEVRRRARRAHRRALAARWPRLFTPEGTDGVALEHTWAGVMGASPSRRHVFDRIADGLWAAAGFTGAGIALGTTAGELLAEWAAGRDSQRLRQMRALPAPGKLPPQPFAALGIRWRVGRMNASAGDTL